MGNVKFKNNWQKMFGAFLISVFLFSSIYTFSNQASASESTKDQAYDSAIGAAHLTLMTSSTTRAQTFSPTMKYLTQVDLYLKDRVNGSWIEIALINEPTGEIVTTSGTRMGSGDGWQEIGISATLDTNNVYRIKAYNQSNLDVKWTYSNGNPYAGGMMFFGASTYDANADLNFRTYGYNDPTPSTTPAPAANESTTNSTSLSENTSTSIKKPSSLTASFSSEKKGVDLSWKASGTSDITGYLVFRSESYSKDYSKIGDTNKETLSYLDENYSSGKTYYYQIRAYKGSEQSASSNIASATISDDVAPSKPKVSIIDTTTDSLTARWRKSEATNLDGYTINLYKGSEKIRTKDLKADINQYSFLNLESGVLYKVELIAKDSDDKTSSPAYAFGVTKLPEILVQIFNTINLIASAIILILLGILTAKTIKTIRKNRI